MTALTVKDVVGRLMANYDHNGNGRIELKQTPTGKSRLIAIDDPGFGRAHWEWRDALTLSERVGRRRLRDFDSSGYHADPNHLPIEVVSDSRYRARSKADRLLLSAAKAKDQVTPDDLTAIVAPYADAAGQLTRRGFLGWLLGLPKGGLDRLHADYPTLDLEP